DYYCSLSMGSGISVF
nr:immunoglobulin light chain junction region [Macaca mulatta]MOY07513.1 immunoglobulin light chain junction region [Macaca mulatta]MOY07596.1 immunoglobulin light chain junction region [Macaca mulatta]